MLAIVGHYGRHCQVWCLLQLLRWCALLQQSLWHTPHFNGKVDAVRSSTTGAPSPVAGHLCSASLSSYNRVTTRDIQRLLNWCPNKQHVLDPVPTWLVKAAGTTVTSYWWRWSMHHSILPRSRRQWSMQSLVSPLVKKPGMGLSLFNSYRPNTSLPFV